MLDRFRRIDEGVRRSRQTFFGRVSGLFDRRQLDDNLWGELEELLLEADVGVSTTDMLLARVRGRVQREGIRDSEVAREVLKCEMVEILNGRTSRSLRLCSGRLNVILVVGVNGSGKTTTIAKLAKYLQGKGLVTVVAAADTFRAAAIDQMRIWSERAGVHIVAHQPGADPGSVVFDAWQSSRARRADVLVIDTAGRLHTKVNLMEELKKIRRVLEKQDPSAPHEVLLVLDATTGQNALSQAREFLATVGVSGLALTKVDGTARGGAVFAIGQELKLPIKFLGTGETIDDLVEFEPEDFVEVLLRSN